MQRDKGNGKIVRDEGIGQDRDTDAQEHENSSGQWARQIHPDLIIGMRSSNWQSAE